MAEAAVQPPPIEVIDVESLPKKEVIDVEEAVNLIMSTPISSRGFTKSTAISVERYSEERYLHLATIASHRSPGVEDDDELRILEFPPPKTPSLRKRPFSGRSVIEVGQSSNSATYQPEPVKEKFVCSICVEEKDVSNSFRVQGCTHSYCTECISRYVASKLQDNVTSIKCPVSECGGRLEPEHCYSILPKQVFDRWANALCEALILDVDKFYCPFKDCSAMLIHDRKEAVKESECPYCRRLFCVQCKAPWHSEIDCKEYQKLNENEREVEDIMLMKTAEKQHWRRCPNCRFYVQKIDGCRFVKCRCGVDFCYSCGTKPRISHYCEQCKC